MYLLEQNVQVGLIIEEECIADIGELIEQAGGVVVDNARPYDPPADELNDYTGTYGESLMLIAIKLPMTMLIQLITETLGEYRRMGGHIIDVSGTFPICRPVPFIEHGMIVLITSQGLAVYEPERKIEAIEAIEALFQKSALI